MKTRNALVVAAAAAVVLFSAAANATATIPLEGETPPAFFNAKIEEE